MSQVTQPQIAFPARVRTRRAATLAALLALVAATAVVLVLAIDGGSSSPAVPVGGKANPVASDGFNTAVSSQSRLSSRPSSPDESRVAASIGASSLVTGPDESRVAASIAGR